MHKTLLVAFIGAGVLAAPAFAQVYPAGTGTGASASAKGSGQAGVASTGALSHAGVGASADGGAGTDPSSSPALGLGDLLKQTQANDPNASTDTTNDGADSTASPNPPDAKSHRRNRARGH